MTPRRLSTSKVRERLTHLNAHAAAPKWRVATGRLRKRFVFDDFVAAFRFMSEVALVCEAMDHHPRWTNSYATVDVALSTHSVDGLSALDFDLASRMEKIRGRPAAARRSPS